MLRPILLALTMIGIFLTPLSAQSRFNAEQTALIQRGLNVTADDFILPSYRSLANTNHKMTAAIASYCDGSGSIEAVRKAYAESFLAWQRASIIQVGPVMDAEGPMRFQLWPDPKGFSRRAVRAAVRNEDPLMLQDNGLEKRSIALVNLSALEYLLYEDLPAGSYACGLSRAISHYQETLSNKLVAAWTKGSEFRKLYESSTAGNARFASVDALLRELLAGAVVYSDRLRKFKIGRGLGGASGSARKERTEAIKSGLGLTSIETGFRTLSEFYNVPFGVFDVTPDLGASMDYYALAQTASSIADALSLESRSLAQIAQEDGAFATKLRGFGELVLYHEAYLKTGLPQSIGLTTGFTSVDGD